MNKLGNLLRELRGKESLRDASKRIGISHTYLDTIEKGFDKRSGSPVKPTPETLELISKAYNFPYNDLMSIAGYLPKTEKITVGGREIELTPGQYEVIKEMLKHPTAFNDLLSNPKRNVNEMISMWSTFKKQLKEIENDEKDYIDD